MLNGGAITLRGLERGNEVLPRRLVEIVLQRAPGAQHALREERRVHQRLPLAGEVQEVGRAGIDGARHRPAREIGVAAALPSLVGIVRRQLDPRRKTGQQPADRLEVGDARPGRARGLFDRHPGLQRAGSEVVEDRIGEAAHDADPDGTVRGAAGRRVALTTG